jgi:hypothetical protein
MYLLYVILYFSINNMMHAVDYRLENTSPRGKVPAGVIRGGGAGGEKGEYERKRKKGQLGIKE